MRAWYIILFVIGCMVISPRCSGSLDTKTEQPISKVETEWQASLDRRMSGFKSQFPKDALPYYWEALRAYERGDCDQAVSAITKGLQLEAHYLILRHDPSLPSQIMFTGLLMRLVQYQTAYAEKLVQAGDKEKALEIVDLSIRMADQAIDGVEAWNADFTGSAATWIDAMRGKAKILRLTGNNDLADEISRQAKEMKLFIKERVASTIKGFDPLVQQEEALYRRKDLSDAERKRRLAELEEVWRNAHIRRNRAWVLEWNMQLSRLNLH